MGDPPKRRNWLPEAGAVEHPDEMIYISRSHTGEITDAGIEDFAELERVNARYLRLTLTGRDADKPVVLMIESEAPITVRGKRDVV